MKKLVLIALAFATLQATAQGDKKREGNHQKQERIHKNSDFSPEEMATVRTKKMTLDLDLTEAQQRDIQKINLVKAKERQTKMKAHKKMRQNKKSEKPSKDERFNRMNERLDNQIAHKKQMKSILSKEQFEKFEKMSKRKEMKQRKHKKERTKKERSKRS